jgi:WD40 repeat protein
MSRIFISYSRKNVDSAIALRDWLAAQGWDDVFLDLGIPAGERWERALYQGAVRCEAVLFLLSRAWLAADWCLKEFELAQRLNKRAFGLLIEDIPVHDLPPMLTRTFQVLPLVSGRDHIMLRAILPGTQDEAHVTFSKEGLTRLRIGLELAGLDAKFFEWPPKEDPKRPPYRGLLPLEAADAGIFFGREAPTIEALDRVRGMREGAGPRFLVVLGASGAGKSSFLRAGLLPRLARDDRNYLVLPVIRPERAAINGEAGLLQSVHSAFGTRGLSISRAEIRDAIMAGPANFRELLKALIAGVRTAPAADDVNTRAPTVVLAIDQGEELFLTEGASESAALLSLLRDLLDADAPAVLMVFTIRSDSYEQLQTAKAFEGMAQQTLSLTPMPRGAYQAVIEGPAARLRDTERPLAIEPTLTQALFSDVGEEGGRDSLPLLAFTLERLYLEYGGRGRLTLKDYESLGRITGSIEAAIERVMNEADKDPRIPADRNARFDLLRRGLIPWLAGIDPDTGSPRRQKARMSEIPKEARPLIDLLTDQRLLSTDLATDTRERTIEPAHESLLRLWNSLQGWLREDFAALVNLETVKRSARDWAANAKGEDWLSHRASRLEEAERILLRPDLAGKLDPTDTVYLAACRSREKAALLALERQLRRQRRLTIAAAAAAAIMTAVGGLAYWQKTKADAATVHANLERVRADENAADARKQRDIAERETAEATRYASRADARTELLRSQIVVKDTPKEAISRAYEASLKMKSLGAQDEAVSLLNSVLKAAREVPFRSPYSHYRLNLGTGFIRQPDPLDIFAPPRQNPGTIFASRDFTGVVDDSGRAFSKPLGSGDASGSLVNAAAWLDDKHFILATGAWTREDGKQGEQAPWNSALRSYSVDGTLDREYLEGHQALLLSVAALRNRENSAVLAGDESGNLIIAFGSDAPVVMPTGIPGPLKNIIVLANYPRRISLVFIFGRASFGQGQYQDGSNNIEAISQSLSSLFKMPVHISYLGDQQADDDSCALIVGYKLFVCDGNAISVWTERSDRDLAASPEKVLSLPDEVRSSDQLLKRSSRFMTHSSHVTAIALSPQSPILVTGSKTGEIRAWSLDGRLLDEIAAGTGEVDALGFIESGSLLLGSTSGAYRAWDVSDLARQWQALRHGDRAEDLRRANWIRFFDPGSLGLKSPSLDQLKSLMPEGSYSIPDYAGWERFLVAEHSWGLRIFDGRTSEIRDVRLAAVTDLPDNSFEPTARVARGGNDTICVVLPNRHKLYAINAEMGSITAEWSLPHHLEKEAAVVAHVRNGRATCWVAAGDSVQQYSPIDKSVTSFNIQANNLDQISGLFVPDESDTVVLAATMKGLPKSSTVLLGRIAASPDRETRPLLPITSSVTINGIVSRLAVSADGYRIAIAVGEDSILEVRVFDGDLNIVTTLPGSPEHFIDLQFNKDATHLRGFGGTFSEPEFAYEQNLGLEVLLTTARRRIEAWKDVDSRATLYKAATTEKSRDKARDVLTAALSQYPSDATFKLLLANNEFYSGNGAEAKARGILLYDDSILLDKFNPIAHYMRGRARASLGDHKGAVEDFTSAIELPHILPQVRSVPGPFNTIGGIASLSYTLNVKNVAELRLRRANSLAEVGDWQPVLEDVAWLRRQSSTSLLAYELEGNALEKSGDAKRAVDSFNTALELFQSGKGYGLEDLDVEEKLASWRQYKLADYKSHLADIYRTLGQRADSAASHAEAKNLILNAYASPDLTAETRKRLDRLSENLSK